MTNRTSRAAWAIQLALMLGAVTALPAHAASPAANACKGVQPEPFPRGQPVAVNDPQSGVSLHLDSEGHHMTAIDRGGKVLWQRDPFDDPRLIRRMPPLPQIAGVPTVRHWKRSMRSHFAQIGIDRIVIEPDCQRAMIDREFPKPLHGHYILAGSGTHLAWLIDSRTGDMQLEAIN